MSEESLIRRGLDYPMRASVLCGEEGDVHRSCLSLRRKSRRLQARKSDKGTCLFSIDEIVLVELSL